MYRVLAQRIPNCYFPVVHVGAHCFNFEQLCHSWGKASVMDHRLSQLSGDKHWVNPIRRANAVSTVLYIGYRSSRAKAGLITWQGGGGLP